MKLPLAYYGDPVLRTKCRPIETFDDNLITLIDDMVETMHACNGIGLAAPQIHRDIRLFVMHVPPEDEDLEGTLHIFINPEILEYSEETEYDSEGCLSIPNLRADIERPCKITVRAKDAKGNPFTKSFEGLEARCILHENDHINGVLFIDRVKGKERKLLEPKLRELKNRFKKK